MIAATVPSRPDPVRRLPGMRDLSGEAYRRKQVVERRLSDAIARYGYQPLDVPVLESTELFLRKSGGDLASQMYSFSDPGSNSVSLRPEFTSAIMRRYLESIADTGQRPVVRWQYAGPVFRYDLGNPPPADNSGQFTQVGAELVGSGSILADAELLALAAGIPDELGINDYRLRLADLDVLDSVLNAVGLSDRARAFIIASMNRIGDGADSLAATLRRADELHIVAGRGLPNEETDLAAAVSGLPDDAARAVLSGFMRWNGSPETPLGHRSPDEIIDRLLRKLRGDDASDAIERGLALAGQLAGVRGEPVAALSRARTIVAACGADTAPVERLAELVTLISAEQSLAGRLLIDFSLARGIAYYNGIIFDVTFGSGDVVLGGGGRYDALALALGGSDAAPALGFAYTLESLLSVMPGDTETVPDIDAVTVSPSDYDSNSDALRAAADIRNRGGIAILDVGSVDTTAEYPRRVAISSLG